MRGFAAHGFASAEAFFEAWPAASFDLLLLDVALPGASGFEIAQRVRARDSVGIVMLTALDSNDDHVQGLDAGADVFLSKRSSLEVIEATCHSVLRRLYQPDQGRAATSGASWRLDARHWRLVAPNGISMALTNTDMAILSALFEQPGRGVAREVLLARLEKPETLTNLRNLDNAASRLRRKVQDACGMELPVRSSYGKGYTFNGRCEVFE